MPSTAADARSTYGNDPNQFGDLRLPAGPGPHPVVVLIHGGCFRAQYASLRDLAPMGDALKAEGIATWNIEYRRLGQQGAGWPGTYQDVGAAIDHLRTIARRFDLDLSRVVIVGHSAGGHLAMWSAARGKLPAESAIAAARPLNPIGVIDLAGPLDLRENIENYHAECGAPVITQMLGGTPAEHPDRYREASAAGQLPLGVPQVLIWGEHENFMPRTLAHAYVARAIGAGDKARLVVAPHAGHFEIASPTTSAWRLVKAEIRRLIDRR
ncbi:MAG: alpha/beta hydrolase [Rhizobiaceae bacterium]|nr:MAG: alpha/beta hydrolase [Rhizobiaceae bacterium]